MESYKVNKCDSKIPEWQMKSNIVVVEFVKGKKN